MNKMWQKTRGFEHFNNFGILSICMLDANSITEFVVQKIVVIAG